ncbi:MAG: hypothetical protein ACWA5R_13185 [bacterium]
MKIKQLLVGLVLLSSIPVQAKILLQCDGCSEQQKRSKAVFNGRISRDYDVYVADFRLNQYQRYSVLEVNKGPGIQSGETPPKDLEMDTHPEVMQFSSADSSEGSSVQSTIWVASPTSMDSSTETLLKNLRRAWWLKRNVIGTVDFDRNVDGSSHPALHMLGNAYDITGCSSCVRQLALWAVLRDPATSGAFDNLEVASTAFKAMKLNFKWSIKVQFPNASFVIIKFDENQIPRVQEISDSDGNSIPFSGNVSNRTFVFTGQLTLNDFINWANAHGITIIGTGGTYLRCDASGKCTFYPT